MKVKTMILAAAAFAAPIMCMADAKAKDAAKDAAPAKAAAPAKPAAPVNEPLPPVPDEVAVAKAIKVKRPFYAKFAEAKDMAWKCQQPLVVAFLPAGDQTSQMLEAKALKHKMFAKEFVPANCVLLLWRLKPGKVEMPPPQGRGRRAAPPPKPTTIDARPLKPQEVQFLTAFAISPEARAWAKRNNKDVKFSDMVNYPSVICVDPACRKLLFRGPKFDTSVGQVGFGAWMSQIVDLFRNAKREPVISPALQKIVDNPSEPKKWK